MSFDAIKNVSCYKWNLQDPNFNLPVSRGRWIYCKRTNVVYSLEDQIGSGAASVVFKCREVLPPETNDGSPKVDMDSEYAAKIMDLRALRLVSDFEHEKLKIQREVEILSSLNHPCIVNLVNVIETHNELFLIMELVKNGELFYKIVEYGSLSEDQARYLVLQILCALEYMHKKGVIHRDLKPENILISDEVTKGFFRIKIADFGLAKLVVNGCSVAKTFVGTPQYWAPEILHCSTSEQINYGPEVDFWSLGCIIYVVLGGAYPFDTRLGKIDHLIKTAQFHFKYKRFEKVSEDAKNLIRGLLTVDPKKRLTYSKVLSHPWIQNNSLAKNLNPLYSSLYSNHSFLVPQTSKLHREAATSCIVLGNKHNRSDETTHFLHNQTTKNVILQNEKNTNETVAIFNEPSKVSLQTSTQKSPLLRLVDNKLFSIPLPQENILNTNKKTIQKEMCSKEAIVPVYTPPWLTTSDQQNEKTTHKKSTLTPRKPYKSKDQKQSDSTTEFSYNGSKPKIVPLPSGSPWNLDTDVAASRIEVVERLNQTNFNNKCFDFNKLLHLQLLIMKKLYWVKLATRSFQETASPVSQCLAQAQAINMDAVSVTVSFETTSINILNLLSDLSLAVEEKEIGLANSLFKSLHTWISELQRQVGVHQKRLNAFIRSVGESVNSLWSVKVATDQALISMAALNSHTSNNIERLSVLKTNRVESVGSNTSFQMKSKSPKTIKKLNCNNKSNEKSSQDLMTENLNQTLFSEKNVSSCYSAETDESSLSLIERTISSTTSSSVSGYGGLNSKKLFSNSNNVVKNEDLKELQQKNFKSCDDNFSKKTSEICISTIPNGSECTKEGLQSNPENVPFHKSISKKKFELNEYAPSNNKPLFSLNSKTYTKTTDFEETAPLITKEYLKSAEKNSCPNLESSASDFSFAHHQVSIDSELSPPQAERTDSKNVEATSVFETNKNQVVPFFKDIEDDNENETDDENENETENDSDEDNVKETLSHDLTRRSKTKHKKERWWQQDVEQLATSTSCNKKILQRWYDSTRKLIFNQLEALTQTTVKLRKASLEEENKDSSFLMEDGTEQNRDMYTKSSSSSYKTLCPSSSSAFTSSSSNSFERNTHYVAQELLDLLFIVPFPVIEKHCKNFMLQKKKKPILTYNNMKYLKTRGLDINLKSLSVSSDKTNKSLEDSSSAEAVVENRDFFHDQWLTHAFKSTELLIRAVDELRRVWHLSRQCLTVWLNLTSLIESLFKMKSHSEILVGHIVGSEMFKQRFHEVLEDYYKWWSVLKHHTGRYALESTVKLNALDDFAIALANIADRVDTINACRWSKVPNFV